MKIEIRGIQAARDVIRRAADKVMRAEADKIMEEMHKVPVYRPVTYYGCKECHQRSADMEYLENMPYQPTAEELGARPEFGPRGMNIAHEQFRCACGKVYNWFTFDRGSELRQFGTVESPKELRPFLTPMNFRRPSYDD